MEDYNFVGINKKKYPIRFGMNALRKYGMRTGTTLADLEKLGNGMNLESALQLIFAGIEDGYRRAKQECKLDIEKLADLIDDDHNAIAKCMNILTKHIGGKNEKKPNPKSAKN